MREHRASVGRHSPEFSKRLLFGGDVLDDIRGGDEIELPVLEWKRLQACLLHGLQATLRQNRTASAEGSTPTASPRAAKR